MIVYGSSLSPFVRKVLAFAAEKGVEVEARPVSQPNVEDEFREASPFLKIPAFRDGDFSVADSSAIVHYLEAVKAEPQLIPTEAKARARTIWFDEFADTILAATCTRMFFNRIVAPRFMGREGDLDAADKAEREDLPKALDYLERVIPEGLYLVEDRLTLADISVATCFANFRHMGTPIDAARYPRVTAFAEAMLKRPSFASRLEQESKMLAG
jgi:glutathione S-transferase